MQPSVSHSVRRNHPSPCPSPARGREPCGAHLRNSRKVSADGLPEMCACRSAQAGTHTPQQGDVAEAAINEIFGGYGSPPRGDDSGWVRAKDCATKKPACAGLCPKSLARRRAGANHRSEAVRRLNVTVDTNTTA